jgi:hypothetical protein
MPNLDLSVTAVITGNGLYSLAYGVSDLKLLTPTCLRATS